MLPFAYLSFEFRVLILNSSVLRFHLNEFALYLGFFLDDVSDGDVIGRSSGAGRTATKHIGWGRRAGICNIQLQTV
jgi:hypothetical protein